MRDRKHFEQLGPSPLCEQCRVNDLQEDESHVVFGSYAISRRVEVQLLGLRQTFDGLGRPINGEWFFGIEPPNESTN